MSAHYDPDARQWMVQVDRFQARPATEREKYDAVVSYLTSALIHGRDELGADVVEDIVENVLRA